MGVVVKKPHAGRISFTLEDACVKLTINTNLDDGDEPSRHLPPLHPSYCSSTQVELRKQ